MFGSLQLSCFVPASGDLGEPRSILSHMFALLILDKEIEGF